MEEFVNTPGALEGARFSMNQLQTQTMATLSELTSVIGQVDVVSKTLEVMHDSSALDFDLLNNLTDDNQPLPPPQPEEAKDDNVATLPSPQLNQEDNNDDSSSSSSSSSVSLSEDDEAEEEEVNKEASDLTMTDMLRLSLDFNKRLCEGVETLASLFASLTKNLPQLQRDLQLVKKDVAFLVESRKKVQQPITSFLKTASDDSSNKRKTAPSDDTATTSTKNKKKKTK